MPRIDDGFPTTVHFEEDPTVQFWEKSVTPPGIQGGGANDTTTMRNIAWRTRSPKKLRTLGDFTMTAAYDPEVYTSILAMLQVNQRIMVIFPDGSGVRFWGFLDDFSPNEITEGEQPDAEITVIPSNQNNDDPPDEVAPAHVADTDPLVWS